MRGNTTKSFQSTASSEQMYNPLLYCHQLSLFTTQIVSHSRMKKVSLSPAEEHPAARTDVKDVFF